MLNVPASSRAGSLPQGGGSVWKKMPGIKKEVHQDLLFQCKSPLQAGDPRMLLGQFTQGLFSLGQFGPFLLDDFSRRLVNETGVGQLAADALDFALQTHRSEEHKSDLQSLMRTSYAVF